MGEEAEAFKEGAKAVQEVAKATGKVVDAGRGAGGWLDRIFGNGIEHAVARRWSDREMTKRIEAAIWIGNASNCLCTKWRNVFWARELHKPDCRHPRSCFR